MLEDIAAVLGHPWKDPLRRDQHVAHFSEREAKRYARQREYGWSVDCMRKRAREIAVCDRAWRDRVHRPTDRVVPTRMQHHSSHVLDMDPWHPLPAVAEPAAHPHSKGR